MAAANKRCLPKKATDWLALIFILTAIHLVGFFELFVILPYIDGDRTNTFWLHACLGLYLYFNIMACLVVIMMTDSTTSRNGVIMPSILKPGWRFCSACEANAPPRSYHCWACDICILRRDHHCVFAGNCIGFSNYRYFISFMLFITISAMYCNYLNMDYTFEMLHGFSFKTFFTMIMPLFSWILGITETYSFLVAFVSALCIFGFLLTAGLFGYHFNNMFNGQTTYEKAQKIKDWDCGWQNNMAEVLGKRWYLVWLGAWIPSPITGNGIDFAKKRPFENVKDI